MMPSLDYKVRCCGFRCTTVLIPGGAIRCLLKSYWPGRYTSTEIFWLILVGCNILRVRIACSSNLFHNFSRQLGSTELTPAIKWFLNVRMVRSAAFLQCTCGGTISKLQLFFCISSSSSEGASLSSVCNYGS